MARRSLYTGIKKLVTSALRLLTPKKPEFSEGVRRPPRMKTPKPSAESSYYEQQIAALKKQLEEQQRTIEQLQSRLQLEEDTSELLTVEYEKEPQKPETTPEPVKTEPEPVEYGENDLPYEYTGEDIDTTEPVEIDTTYKNFGSDDSLDVLVDFLKNTDLSGVSSDSPFLDMDPIDQKFLLLDYVQFQHDSNPALFYKGKRPLPLENVPIWGSEFDRFVQNTTDFNNLTAGDGYINTDSLADYGLDEYIEDNY